MIFALKLFLASMLIGFVSIAGRRWGPTVGGWLVSLPLTSAPVILFLAIEQGTAFAIQRSTKYAHEHNFGGQFLPGLLLVFISFWLAGIMLAGWIAFFVLTFI